MSHPHRTESLLGSDGRDVVSAEEVAVLPRWVRLDVEPNAIPGVERVVTLHAQVREVYEHLRRDIVRTERTPPVLITPPDTLAHDVPHEQTLSLSAIR